MSEKMSILNPDFGGQDCRGVLRGECSDCGCDEYDGGSTGKKCLCCNHPPGKHKNLSVPPDTNNGNPDSTQAVTSKERSQSFGAECEDTSERLPLDSTNETGSEPLPFQSAFDSILHISRNKVSPDQLCIFKGCKRQKYHDGKKTHDFCGKTHARLYNQQQPSLNVSPAEKCQNPACKNPKRKDDSGKYFDYCSPYCRDNQRTGGLTMSVPSELGKCMLPGCNKNKYQDPSNGRIHDYCCRSHGFKANQEGLAVADMVTISVVGSQELTTIINKFTKKWAPQKGKCPRVSFVFSITNTKLRSTWDTYKSTLPDQTVEEYFHGTRLECDLTNTNSLCNNEHCGICGIANIGFDRRCIQKNINFQRFGHGFYLAPNSSKCHDYTQGKHGYRAMILFDVCPGGKHQLQKDDIKLTAPPTGCHSVYGKAGLSLNYDELVIYNPDGALPRHIVIYQRDGEHKIAK